MPCRDITPEIFALIENELVRATRHPGEILVLRGQHEFLGDTVLIRDPTRCMALAENAWLIDAILAAIDGSLLERAGAPLH